MAIESSPSRDFCGKSLTGTHDSRVCKPPVHLATQRWPPCLTLLAKASSPAGDQCSQPPPRQLLPPMSHGPSTPPSRPCILPCRSPPTAGLYSLPPTAAAAKSTTSQGAKESRRPPTASASMQRGPQGSSVTPCAPTQACSAVAAGSASPPA